MVLLQKLPPYKSGVLTPYFLWILKKKFKKALKAILFFLIKSITYRGNFNSYRFIKKCPPPLKDGAQHSIFIQKSIFLSRCIFCRCYQNS